MAKSVISRIHPYEPTGSGWRRLHAGCRSGGIIPSPELIPQVGSTRVFTSPNLISTLHRRFACTASRKHPEGPSFITRTVGRRRYANDASCHVTDTDMARFKKW